MPVALGLVSLEVNLALSMIHQYGGMSADQRRRVDSENSIIWKRVLDLVFRSRPVRWYVRWSGSKGGPWQYHRLIDKVELVFRLRHDRLYVSWSTTRVNPRQYHQMTETQGWSWLRPVRRDVRLAGAVSGGRSAKAGCSLPNPTCSANLTSRADILSTANYALRPHTRTGLIRVKWTYIWHWQCLLVSLQLGFSVVEN